ncbi:hypothetical protein Pmar_PMAR024586 [Perkinsus marinus ATCC 50983]|uniref:Uncharacterized protein n=1 Tax=Perkinsus marinus (strain ATCC 50983 / TXsc) TaxID=423536 RepID=C5LTD8_PERM5|nr:hypothetical protein Pmar_PMAR024586 [Perkinsus marinus ATCC 50983]EER00106.1 hypothetical protein Pmar_PMAR024586 [Perkinsus marinus ATCC 50983]|eukprot:XP_002767388.1 hypothetical protein Pmar_PMAR024586 [Perkinsus marinus ATCC 50983]
MFARYRPPPRHHYPHRRRFASSMPIHRALRRQPVLEWDSLLRQYIDSGQWHHTLRLANTLYNHRDAYRAPEWVWKHIGRRIVEEEENTFTPSERLTIVRDMMEAGNATMVLCDPRLPSKVTQGVGSLPAEQMRNLILYLSCYGYVEELGRAVGQMRLEDLKGDSLRLIALHAPEAFPYVASGLYAAAWRRYQMQDPNRTHGLVLMSTTELCGVARMLVRVAVVVGAVEGQGLQKTLQRLGDRLYQRMCDGKVSKSMVVDILEIFSGTWPAPIHEKVLQLGYALLLDNHAHTAIDDSECARVLQVAANAEYGNMALNRILTMRLSSTSGTAEEKEEHSSDDNDDDDDTRSTIRTFHSIAENYDEVEPSMAHRLSFKALSSSASTADDVAQIVASLGNFSTQNECSTALRSFCDRELTLSCLCQMNMPQLSAVLLVLAMQHMSATAPCTGECSCMKSSDRVTEYDYDPRAVRVVEKFYSSYKVGAARKGKMIRAPMVPKLVWHQDDKRWQQGNYQTRESVGAEPFNGDAREPQRRCGCHPTVVSNTADNAVDSAIRRVLRVLAVGQVVMARSMGQLDVLRDMKEAEGGLYVPTVFDVQNRPTPLPSKDDILEVYNPPRFITRTDPDLQTVIATRPRPPSSIEQWISPSILAETKAAAAANGVDFPLPSWSSNQRFVTHHVSSDLITALMMWMSSGVHGGIETLSLAELQVINCILALCEVFIHGSDPPEVRTDGVKHPRKRAFINSARPDRSENESVTARNIMDDDLIIADGI